VDHEARGATSGALISVSGVGWFGGGSMTPIQRNGL
jgi:hypothetical protein